MACVCVVYLILYLCVAVVADENIVNVTMHGMCVRVYLILYLCVAVVYVCVRACVCVRAQSIMQTTDRACVCVRARVRSRARARARVCVR